MKTEIYLSDDAKKEIQDIYQEKLDSLAIEYKTKKIENDFGTTNVVITGDHTKKPLVLIHGANGNAAISIEPFIELMDDYCFYAIDVIGQPNYSSETRPSMKDASYATWLESILESLDLSDVTVYGMSFGGFIIMKALVNQSKRISKAILHVPAGVVNGNPFIGIFKVLIPMKKYIRTKNDKYLHEFLAMSFTEEEEFAVRYLSKVLQYMKMDFTPVPVLSKKDAKKIHVPVHVIASDLDNFFPGKKLIARLEKILPSLANTLLLENSKHVASKDQFKLIREFVRSV